MTTRPTSSEEPSETLSADEIAELNRRWAAIEAGEATVSNDVVLQWLQTWGTPEFKPWFGGEPDIEEDLRRLEEFDRTGLAVPGNEVNAWIDSWGTPNELPRPQPRKIK